MEDLLTSSYSPKHQLVFYLSNRLGYYIEHYEIIKRDEKHFLSEGKPLTKTTLKKMLDLVLTTDKSSFATVQKLLPQNILYCDSRPGKVKLIWYTPAQEYILSGINKKPIKIKLPAFIYRIEYDTFFIYASRSGSKRPDLKTQLYHAPLPNIYDDGKVCMGNVKKPKNHTEIADLIEAWQKAFWKSDFNDYLHDTYNLQTLRSAAKNKIQFPNKQLVPLKKTLKSIL